ncbi:hypothetical protein [Actinomadura sp. 21ATH]|uniref:hypothetical protein n=1 Tax=Actinomadura sp. 21ATH TaxID=1735444 RepID=UPI0035BF2013
MKLRTTLGIAGIAAGVGIGLAPAAAAQGPADGEATLVTKSGSRTGAAVVAVKKTTDRSGGVAASKGAKPGEVSAKWFRCWDGWRSGRTFHEKCEGSAYRPYVDCTNGYRYIWGTYSGAREFWLNCPAGSNAIWGGAYG